MTTFLGRMGGEFMALRHIDGGLFSARREVWDESEGEWIVKYAIGDGGMPSISRFGSEELEGESRWKAGDVVHVLGEQYHVRGFEMLES